MKKYIQPSIEVIKLQTEDAILKDKRCIFANIIT